MDDIEWIIKAYEVLTLEIEMDEATKSQFTKEMGSELAKIRHILEEGGLHTSKVIEQTIISFIKTFSREGVPYIFFVDHSYQLIAILTLIKRYATTYKSFRKVWMKYHDDISLILANIPIEEKDRYQLLSIPKIKSKL